MMKETERVKENRSKGREKAERPIPDGILYGRNPIRELLHSERDVDKLLVAKGQKEGSIGYLIELAKERKIPVIETDRQKLDQMCAGGNHQGVVALTPAKSYAEVDDILALAKERGERPFIVILDGIEDPHNLGAVIRTAECCGAHGVIIPKRRAVTLTATVAKASAGAIEHILVARETNLSSVIEKLKKEGLWIFGAEAGETDFRSVDYRCPCAIVMGSEGEGISRLVKEHCDILVSIPMYGKINSMNVSAAAAVVLCEASRQLHNQG